MIIKNPHARIISIRHYDNVVRVGPNEAVKISDKDLKKQALKCIEGGQLVEVEDESIGTTELPSAKAGKPKSGK